MKKIVPIASVWLAVGLAVITLLTKLNIFGAQYYDFFFAATGLAFVGSAVFSWVCFVNVSRRVIGEIENWDLDMQRDIPSFVRKRRIRMITLFGMMIILYVIAFFSQLDNNLQMQEGLLYVLILGLFHCALVTTLVMFKMLRTLAWVQYENQLAKTEES